MAHDGVGFLLLKVLPNVETILGMVKSFYRAGGAQRSASQRLDKSQINKREKFLPFEQTTAFDE